MNVILRSFLAAGALGLTTATMPAQDEKPAKPSVPELIQQLGDRDYQVRKAAEASLRARGSDALEALRKAAADDGDAEVQWRARRLVRQLESGGEGRLQPRTDADQPATPQGRWRGLPWSGDADLEQMFGHVFEQLERDFGVDVPRGRFFKDDFFQNLQQQMEDLRRGNAMGLPGTGQAFNMNIGPDGVRIEITEKDASGKSETKVYEAPDVQTFRDKYPEVAQRYLNGGNAGGLGFGGRFFPGFRTFPTQPLDHDAFGVPMQDAAVVDNGERLGVMVQELSPEVRDFLELEPGQGLRVQGVTEGTLAETMGIAEGDVLLEVAGKKIGNPVDVREALGGVATGGDVTVKVNRRGKEQTLTAKKPAPPKQTSVKKLEPRDGEAQGSGAKDKAGKTIR